MIGTRWSKGGNILIIKEVCPFCTQDNFIVYSTVREGSSYHHCISELKLISNYHQINKKPPKELDWI